MMKKFFLPFISLLLITNINAEFEYKLFKCAYAGEYVDLTVDTKKEIVSVTNIYGPGTTEDAQWVTVLNPFYVYDSEINKIYSASSMQSMMELSGVYSGALYEGSQSVFLNLVTDLDLGSTLMQIKIAFEGSMTTSMKRNINLFLKEFGYSNASIFNGSVIDTYLYTGCQVKKSRDYINEARQEKLAIEKERQLAEQNKIEQQRIELEKLKVEAEMRTRQLEQLEPEVIGSGTGFYINDRGYIVTNFHVINECEYVMHSNEKLQIIASDPVNDISILKSQSNNEKFIKLSNKTVIKGQDIYVIGYPFGTFLSGGLKPQSKTTKGIVSSLQGLNNFYNWFQMDASIQPGNSGGPIIDINGGLKGITVASADYKVIFDAFENIPQNINFGIKVDILRNILDANEIEYAVIDEQGFFDFLFNETIEEIIKNSDKSTLYIECWAKNITE